MSWINVSIANQDCCRNPSLGLTIKAKACEGAGQEVWGNEPSHSQMSSHFGSWIPSSLNKNYRGQNPLDYKINYIIGIFLKHRCLKWAHMTHLGTQNTNYGQMKGRESNC
jgi:hypothetical protein